MKQYDPYTCATDKLLADNDARIQAEVEAEIQMQREQDIITLASCATGKSSGSITSAIKKRGKTAEFT